MVTISFMLSLYLGRKLQERSWKTLDMNYKIKCKIKSNNIWDFPGGPVVKTLHFHCRGHRFDPWSGYQDPIFLVVWPKLKINK